MFQGLGGGTLVYLYIFRMTPNSPKGQAKH